MTGVPEESVEVAVAAFLRGDPAAALDALSSEPAVAERWNLLGTALAKRGEVARATDAYERAAAADPMLHKPHANLAKLAKDAGDLVAARGHLERAVELAPEHARLWERLGAVRLEIGDAKAAIVAYTEANTRAPSEENATQLVVAQLAAGDPEPSELTAARGRLLRAESPAARAARARVTLRLASAAMREHDGDTALALLEAEHDASPERVDIRFYLGDVRAQLGDGASAIALMDGAADTQARCATVLGAEKHVGVWTRTDRRARHVAWALRFAPSAPRVGGLWTASRPERLRVGFVSGDLFPAHAVFRFAKAVIFRLDPARFEVFCFETRRLGAWSDPRVTFRLAEHHDDLALAKLIAADNVHVLIDLSGHTLFSGLGAFRYRPAPMQASWLGDPGTTGLAEMDFRITDGVADPTDAEADYVERLVRLPRSAWCYPFAELPPPAQRTGPLRFGCFNRAAKVGDATLAAWARILERVPAATLLVKGRGFETRFTRARLERAMTARGVDLAHLDIAGWAPSLDEHLLAYRDIDIMLDTFPYAGTTTTCEALGSGIPVVTLAGDTHVSRVGASLLTSAGLADLVTTSWDDYVDCAIRLAHDVERRRELRLTLRETLSRSPLGDARAFARDFENALDLMWQLGPRPDS